MLGSRRSIWFTCKNEAGTKFSFGLHARSGALKSHANCLVLVNVASKALKKLIISFK